MQTECMLEVKARIILVLAQVPKHLKQHIQICLVLVLPSLHRGSGTVKVSILVIISDVFVL